MRKISAVIDDAFGARLAAIPHDHHVWIVESEINNPWIRSVWDTVREHVTSFAAFPGESRESRLIQLLDTMADHHGPGMQDPPWFELHVFGVPPGPNVRDVLAELDFLRIEPTNDGFVAYRD
jgi:hypothetical protein